VSLRPGARLGAYEVLSAIGAGGMGEVYRARDSRLNRDVALKILERRYAFGNIVLNWHEEPKRIVPTTR
jgi:serine/threonine protein kinase